MSITTTIPAVTAYGGTIPNRAAGQTPEQFASNVYPFLQFYNDSFITDTLAFSTALNSFKTEANALETNVNNKESIATAKAQLSADYAEKINATVETGTYSSKEHAIGDLTATGGSAKAWAMDTESPDGTTSKSAKSWADICAGYAGTLTVGTINDTITTLTDTWSSVKINTELGNKQNTLVSGTNIKTVNGTSVLGSGNLVITDNAKLPLTGGTMTGAINTARATVASHATTAQIWTALGNQIDWTGTATTTIFPNAPQAGAERTLICAGACSFTAGSNMLIDGVASGATVTCVAGDTVIVRAISTTQFKLTRLKADGTASVSFGSAPKFTDGTQYQTWSGMPTITYYTRNAKMIEIDTGKYIIGYGDTATGTYHLKVATLSAGAFTFGTEVTITTTGANEATYMNFDIQKISTTSFAIVYSDWTGANVTALARIISLSGTTLTVNSSTSLYVNMGTTNYGVGVGVMDSTHLLFNVGDSLCVSTISGTTISAPSAKVIMGSNVAVAQIYVLSSTTAFVVVGNNNTASSLYAVGVSGTTPSFYAAPIAVNSRTSAYILSSTQIMLAHYLGISASVSVRKFTHNGTASPITDVFTTTIYNSSSSTAPLNSYPSICKQTATTSNVVYGLDNRNPNMKPTLTGISNVASAYGANYYGTDDITQIAGEQNFKVVNALYLTDTTTVVATIDDSISGAVGFNLRVVGRTV